VVLSDIASRTQAATNENRLEQFEALVREHQRSVYNVALRLTGNSEDAQDLTQDAFVRAYRAFDSYKFGTSFNRWLYKIITNLYIDQLRKKKRAPALEYLDERIEVHDGSVSKEVKDISYSPEDVFIKTQMDETLQKALNKISPDFRMAIILCDVEGFSYEEIATIMNTSIGTVRSRIHRARHSLRALLLAQKNGNTSEVIKK
jgi:RNA polymerase sigma factor, sigma-70 family